MPETPTGQPLLPPDLLKMCGEHGSDIVNLQRADEALQGNIDKREQEISQLFDLQRESTANVTSLAMSMAIMKVAQDQDRARQEQDHARVDTLWNASQQDKGASQSKGTMVNWFFGLLTGGVGAAVSWFISHFFPPKH